MITVNPYIYFDGNCEEAFTFYESVFRKGISHISKYKDVPKSDRNIFQESDEKIMHVTLPLSKETMLNGSDNSLVYEQVAKHKTFTLIIHADSKEEVDRLFSELSQNGQTIVPVGLTFWGAYYGQCIDKFGISWKITLASEN
ncbi:VOC family protein [Roseivirga sp. E12]|uniref:VOC family protein n=1 Tax=Roseivirga sp. E12 TaxID=2819237 RepID=UPI001ABCC596|nr:VOC family protein [Roseivirga sp. E12]MBO3698082.1 VOC family protein [Roseivirga sp. E12]